MEWTKETPTKQGFYWCRNTCDEEGMVPSLVKVCSAYDCLVYALDGGSYFIKPHDALEWWGPIEPPK